MTRYQNVLYKGTLGVSAYFYEPSQPFHADPNLQKFVNEQIEKYQVKSFCETGTFRADTLRWMAERYPEMWCCSIERFLHYHVLARIRLRHLNNVHLYKGDSGALLNERISWMPQPILFWLDAHWGGDPPLEGELQAIREDNPKAIVLIDDIGSIYGKVELSKALIERVGFKDVKMLNKTVAAFWLNL